MSTDLAPVIGLLPEIDPDKYIVIYLGYGDEEYPRLRIQSDLTEPQAKWHEQHLQSRGCRLIATVTARALFAALGIVPDASPIA